MNFDGSVKGTWAGAGYIIRDKHGHFISAVFIPLNINSVPEVE